MRQATNDLFDRYPDLSARIVASAWQGAIVGAMLIALPVAVWLSPGGSWVAMHILCSIFFLSCIALRVAATIAGRLGREPVSEKPSPADLPVYSVLVALYREAAVVPELVAALRRIDWPGSKLEIKLVCEEDDVTTLAALDTQALPPNMEVVRVPVFGPRTKPKALAYALPLTGGEFVALYDAEDQPHPGQLLSAWRKFDASPPDVACVQAPLEVADLGGGLISRMFAFEYAGLFRGLLPWLSANRTLLPLGGTSNHFRRSALEEVGGWDPYNVTEDADLGVRLARFGYRTETIACPTMESAPETFATWLPQRTRWFKGWLQTWLVHMRHPALLMVELRPASFLVGQILCAGMVLSALAHPFLFVSGVVLAVDLALERPSATWKSALLAVDIVNVGCGYLSFLLLGWRNLRLGEKLGFWKVVLFHAGLLDDDVDRRLAGRVAALATSPFLGKDAAQADGACRRRLERRPRFPKLFHQLFEPQPDDLRIRRADGSLVASGIVERRQHMPDDFDACAPLVVRAHHRPRRVVRVRLARSSPRAPSYSRPSA